METMEEIYKDYVHYGTVLYSEDFDFTRWGGNFVTIRVIQRRYHKMLFMLSNGDVVHMEEFV